MQKYLTVDEAGVTLSFNRIFKCYEQNMEIKDLFCREPTFGVSWRKAFIFLI